VRDVLDRVSTHPASRIDDLLPDRRVLPDPSHGRRAWVEWPGRRRPCRRVVLATRFDDGETAAQAARLA
jgi:hypothetical protein